MKLFLFPINQNVLTVKVVIDIEDQKIFVLKTVISYLICDKCFNVKKGVCDISKNLLYVILFAEEQKNA